MRISSYKILAPAIMDAEPNPKIATQKCLENTTLDPDFYRIGHTKARKKIIFPFISMFYVTLHWLESTCLHSL